MEGNQQKMREALDAAMRFIGNLEIEPYSPLDEDASELRQKIMDALSAPARQCDVGTAEEQVVRFRDAMVHECFADEYCRCKDAAQCFARWAQTPYAAQEGVGE